MQSNFVGWRRFISFSTKNSIRNGAFGSKNWHHIGFQLEVGFGFGAAPEILCENITKPCFDRMCTVAFNLGNGGKRKCVIQCVEWHREKIQSIYPVKINQIETRVCEVTYTFLKNKQTNKHCNSSVEALWAMSSVFNKSSFSLIVPTWTVKLIITKGRHKSGLN